MAKESLFEEFPEEAKDMAEFMFYAETVKDRKARRRRADLFFEVGVIPEPTPEMLDQRARYDQGLDGYYKSDKGIYVPELSTSTEDLYLPSHYIRAHEEIFANSTGIKPLCDDQKDSVQHSQIIIQHGGRVVKGEPRGFGKTSRSCNEGILGTLQGHIPFLLILGSSVEKAVEILDTILTELYENEELFKLYPRIISCFRHAEQSVRVKERQTYQGEKTYLLAQADTIRFPIVPGEKASGAIIKIRPKKNVRGLYHVDKAGPTAGQRRRPTLVIFDDIQTDEEAENENTVNKIVRTIKKSVLRSGSHQKRLSYIMACTPICPGDVAHHFILKENVQHVLYRMLKSRSNHEDLWFGEYATRLLDFNKTIPGSQIRAALNALSYYQENREPMDEGAEAAWEWCYEYNDVPQVEISGIQHAYNIMILEGIDVFESECQCNVTAGITDKDITYCTAEHIRNQHHPYLHRRELSIKDREIVTHIDVGLEYLTYVTCASPANTLEPKIIDYGTLPAYPGRYGKGKVSRTLATVYPHLQQPEDRVYQGIYDLVTDLATRTYRREDGVHLSHRLILVDQQYLTEYVFKAIRSTSFRSITYGAQGEGYRAKDKTIGEKKYSDACTKHYYTVESPTPDRTLMKLIVDVNFMKTQVHIAFSKPPGTAGSLSLFIPEFPSQHDLLAEHCVAEIPAWDVDEKTDRRVVIWTELGQDNEGFDNIVGCFAGFSMLNIPFDTQAGTHTEAYDISEFIKEHS